MTASNIIIILLLLATFVSMALESRFTPDELSEMGIHLENSSTPETI